MNDKQNELTVNAEEAERYRYERQAMDIVTAIHRDLAPQLDDNDGGEILGWILDLCVLIQREAAAVSRLPPQQIENKEDRGTRVDRERDIDGQDLAQSRNELTVNGAKRTKQLIAQIRARREKRRAPQVGTCQACGHQQEMMPAWQPIASSMAEAMWKCDQCGGQIMVTFTMSTDPGVDEDLETLLERLAARLTPAPAPAWQPLEDGMNQAVEELRNSIETLRADARRVAGETSAPDMERLWTGKAIAYETVLGAMRRLWPPDLSQQRVAK